MPGTAKTAISKAVALVLLRGHCQRIAKRNHSRRLRALNSKNHYMQPIKSFVPAWWVTTARLRMSRVLLPSRREVRQVPHNHPERIKERTRHSSVSRIMSRSSPYLAASVPTEFTTTAIAAAQADHLTHGRHHLHADDPGREPES